MAKKQAKMLVSVKQTGAYMYDKIQIIDQKFLAHAELPI